MRWWGEKEDAAAREGHPDPPMWALDVLRRQVHGGVLGFAVAGLLLLAPTAIAAPPANDDFADAEDLGSALPVNVTRSNVDATEEADDPRTLSAPQHSVWFRWEAPSAEPISIDTCNSEFSTTLAVFSGSSLNSLTRVGEDSNSDGRFCSAASGVAFRAVAGTVYSIMVAGNGFHFPEGPVPATEGSFDLGIAAIPLPANDDFAHPVPIETSVIAYMEGVFVSSASWADGFNWNATKEPGEPDHAGDPGGASVWYRWTAPRSGQASVGACDSPGVLLGLYTGDAINTLTPVALESRPISCFVNFAAVAGDTYRIAVDGRFDSGTGQPLMTSFTVNVSMYGSGPAKTGSAESRAPTDVTPPRTTISKRVLKRRPSAWVLAFGSNEPGSTFRCKLDKHRFAKCRSPKRYEHLRPGPHTFKVFAVDPAGNADPSPAVAHFAAPGKAHASRRDISS